MSVSFTSCNNAFFERGTNITISDETLPPSFRLSGSGSVQVIIFHGPYKEINVREIEAKLNSVPLWQISLPLYTLISDLPIIQYGIVPFGFEQTLPINSQPPSFVEGMCYRVIAPTNGAHEGILHFCIREKKVVKVEGP